MKWTGLAMILGTWMALGIATPAPGQLDSSTNGQPGAGEVDEAAVAELARAEALLSEEGREREMISITLPLVAAFEETEDYGHLVDSLFYLGEAYYHLGEWSSAERYMSRAADLGYRHFPDEMSAYPLKVLGECYFEQGRFEEALASFQERAQMLRRTEEAGDLAGALFDVAGILINLDREQEALELLAEAEQANNTRAGELSKPDSGATQEERDANVVDHAEIVYHMAIANFRLAQYNQAKVYLDQAYAFFKSINEAAQLDVADRLVSVLDDLVLVNEELGDETEADKYRRERDRLNR